VVANDFGVIDMDAASVGDAWNSGEALTVTLIDQDLNKNTLSNEDLVLANTTNTALIPSLKIGSPLILDDSDSLVDSVTSFGNIAYVSATIDKLNGTAAVPLLLISTGYTGTDLNAIDTDNTYFNWNVANLLNSTETLGEVALVTADGSEVFVGSATSGIEEITAAGVTTAGTGSLYLNVTVSAVIGKDSTRTNVPIFADVFSFGGGVNNAIYRILLEETGDNTATFAGTVEYTMLNQINIDLDATYTDLATIDQDVDIIIEQDMTDEDSPRVNYLDLGKTKSSTA
jgi:hypothetical protein